jgi:hypothetical protein
MAIADPPKALRTDASTIATEVPTCLRRTARVAGAFYLITFISSIPAVVLLDPVLNHSGYIVSSGADTRVIVGCILDLINAIACIGSAVTLFPVIKRQHEGVALGLVAARMFEAAVIVIGVVSLLSIVTLRQKLGGPGTDDGSLVAIGEALLAVRNWTFVLGPGLVPGINALLLGYLLYRSSLVPRLIPTLGLIGAPLLIASAVTATLRNTDPVVALTVVATVPIFFWELSLGLWLFLKGFKPSAITTGA